jgi:hypothetical protein
MKHTHLIAVALVAGSLLLTTKVSAADDAKPEKKKPAAAKKISKERPLPGALGKLSLSDEQKQAVTALLKETAEKRKEAGRDKAKQGEVQKAHQTKLAEILGEAKMAEFNKLNAEMAKSRQRGGNDKKNSKPTKKKTK